MSAGRLRLAVVGGGWAGLAAAVEAVERGHRVVLFETAGQLGGRARSVQDGEQRFDNGQHILIGAYVETLRLMRRVGAQPERSLLRLPLTLVYPDGQGLRLPGGHPLVAFARGVLGARHWPLGSRAALLAAAAGWMARRFQCAPSLTVAQLAQGLPREVLDDLVEPLCVAALNTPAQAASASVFLRVLKDGLFSGPGSADLLLPRASLSELFPWPAQRWLREHGADLQLGARVQSVVRQGAVWRVGESDFDAVVLGCSATEAARLAAPSAPAWAAQAAALRYEPIITTYLSSPGARLPLPMVALREGPEAPAQFAFDLGMLAHAPGRFAFVCSGAGAWAERGLDACAQACAAQARQAFPEGTWPVPPTVERAFAEKRATFACTPGLQRPPMRVSEGLFAAGDYVDGPYPATLEGAVRSGIAAVQGL